ncbi:MAG: uroporphyrinogen decarboxylase [Gammaproteobacteria bacterium]|nr:uroporphyrinogen decarboxylase [Gammaproteobacteria bacterium]
MYSVSPLKNDRLLRALRREPVDMTPIWIMRQAGRYLPEYRAIRARAGSFMTLCKTPQLACEVTLQPIERFNLDAAILFSDILTIPDAMGLGLYFVEGEGPKFERPILSARDVANLGVPDPEKDLRYVCDAVRLTQKTLANRLPLIGFCGSPWTLATYMTEGQANKDFPVIRAMMRESPKTLHALLDVLARSVTEHLNAQIAAGVSVVMIFDTWGGMLNTADYEIFSLRYIQQIIAGLHRQNAPCILFTKNGSEWIEQMISTGCDAIGLDWQISLDVARQRAKNRVALQGNLDPAILKTTPDQIRASVKKILTEYGTGSGHIFNLGHGITPDVPPEHVAVLVDAVHEMSVGFHTS